MQQLNNEVTYLVARYLASYADRCYNETQVHPLKLNAKFSSAAYALITRRTLTCRARELRESTVIWELLLLKDKQRNDLSQVKHRHCGCQR